MFFKSLAFFLFFSSTASAKLLQIIHTNDLHSQFAGDVSGKGGYARVKTLIAQLKAQAQDKNIPSLYLDAGDFGEGSPFYFSNEGLDSFKALDHLGVDVAVLGNHDYMLGGHVLRDLMTKSNLEAKIISANISGKEAMGLTELLPNFVDYNIDGMKVRIFGLSTTEIHYQYPLRPEGKVTSSHKAGIWMAEKAKEDKVDFLISLSHTGIKKDTLLAENSKSIDVIIGGHDHIFFNQPKMVENLTGDLVPIFQIGAHGIYVGTLIVDLQGNGKFKIVDYKIHDVTNVIPEDPELKMFVEEAAISRDRYFNRDWNEVIGFSTIPLSGLYEGVLRNPQSCWSKHVARMTRMAGDTQLGMQIDIFNGSEVAAGEITFGNIIQNFPRLDRTNKGWTITKGWVRGLILKQVLKLMRDSDLPLFATIDGLTYYVGEGLEPITFNPEIHDTELAMIDGYFINNLSYYSISLPTIVPHAMGKVSHLLRRLVIQWPESTNQYYWELLENYIRTNSPLTCLNN